ncbi:MAG: hypothetical protein JRG91_08980, partial [Deltaproteobacteria bacterium]|nr:hypothetical protein [Deltaproteobacteria bacterium]
FYDVCPLTRRRKDLRPEFVDACIRGWSWLIEIEPEMHEIYRDWSQVLRRRCGQFNQPVHGFDMQGRWTILRPKRPGPSRSGNPYRPK